MAATLEDDDRSAVVVTRRRTKIVATLGPVSRHEGVLERLLEAGMDVARINLSHGSTAEHAESVATVRRAGPRRWRSSSTSPVPSSAWETCLGRSRSKRAKPSCWAHRQPPSCR